MSEEDLQKHQKRKAHLTVPEIAPIKPVKNPKYRNVKTVVDGIKFDSKKEWNRWTQLLAMQVAGEIRGLERQRVFELIPKQVRADGKAERAVKYICDFAYFQGNREVVEDCKGLRTPLYILKRKMLLFIHGITVFET